MDGKIKYTFSAKVWKYTQTGGWHFVSLPGNTAGEIRELHQWQEEGWGRLKVKAKTGNTEWDTAIWFDTKSNTYLLPIKADVRKKEKLRADSIIEVSLWL